MYFFLRFCHFIPIRRKPPQNHHHPPSLLRLCSLVAPIAACQSSKNKSQSWFKLIRAVIDNGLSYICQVAILERTILREGRVLETRGDIQIIYTTSLLTRHLSGFDIACTEKSTTIRFSIHSIEINFPFLHDRFPGEDVRRGINVRQRKDTLSTEI